jgi:FkbM family methyltransferase
MARTFKVLKAKQIFYLLKNAAEKKPKITTKITAHGKFCGLQNDYLFQCAVADGINEHHFGAVADLYLSEFSNSLDIGSNIGTHAIRLSKIAPKGTVWAFEPQSLTYSILQNNILFNACANVRALKFAVSNQEGDVVSMESFSYQGEKINNGGLSLGSESATLGDMVLSKRLDALNLPKIDFIKLDIQGSETAAIQGGIQLIQRDRPILFVEVEELYLKKFNTSSKELLELILGLNYTIFRIETTYPCDHLCFPNENLEFLEAKLEALAPIGFSKIQGERLILKFDGPQSQNYSSLEII